MELFCALLTGFFLWLFLFHWHHSALARAREVAGELLINVRHTRYVVQAGRPGRLGFLRSFLGLFVVVLLVETFLRAIWLDVLVAGIVCILLELAFPGFRKNAPLELRERGVIRRKQSDEDRPGCLAFTPWEEIAGCKWCVKLPDRYVDGRFLLLERYSFSTEEVEGITAAVGRFVPVFNVYGKRLVKPEAAVRAKETVLPRQGGGDLRFQFTLQSLMLLMVVVSCAASCYGIHYRRLRPQREAVAQLQAFKPNVTYVGDSVSGLDFMGCKAKPGDEDLICLKRLQDIGSLHLDGSPISDAGLKHLYPLKSLKTVSLSSTKVTQKGVDDLKRALPNVKILWSPPPPTPTAGPVGGQ